MINRYTKAGSGVLLAWLAASNVWAETYGFPSTAPVVPVTATAPVAPPATPPAPAAAVAPAVNTAPAAAPQVTRAAFTSSIVGREPVDQITQTNAGQQVYYFTELVGLQGHVITHKWERDGTFQLGLQFPVSNSPWRVNSSKSISPNLPGTWTVTVLNDDGSILRRDTLLVSPVNTPVAPPVPVTPPVPAATSTPPAPPAQPVIPPPAQPLTTIPPKQQRPPVSRPETPASPATDKPSSNTSGALPFPDKPADSAPATTGKPIWETLSR